MKHIINDKLKPDAYYPSLDRVQFDALYRRGFRLVLIDLDNTLSAHGATQADDYALTCLNKVTKSGLECWIVSNAAKKRGLAYGQSVPVPIRAMAGKPSPKAVLKICAQTGIDPEQTVLIGDQLFTDVLSAKRAGCHAILVSPRFTQEAINVKLKRLLEKPLCRRFHICCADRKTVRKHKWREIS